MIDLNYNPENSKTTVVVGMSGGVDSSVSALILKKQGYNVIGLFMKNWDEVDANGNCTSEKDYEDVARVCDQLEIPYYGIEFVKEYRENVFQDMVDGYKKGITPNPDILCNREIKFKVFLQKALDLGADYLATGHYCQVKDLGKGPQLAKGVDPGKDQSYFLYTLKTNQLEKVMFPIGGIEKKVVRQLAEEYNLSTKAKKDSTGICFIGERNFRNFLSQFISFGPGSFESLKGEVVGKHMGAAFYTIGQRKGLGLGGPGAPWYVVGKDMGRNVVIVERGEDHPALFTDELIANDLSWVHSETFPTEFPFSCRAKVRYRQEDQECEILGPPNAEGELRVRFPAPQRAVAAGQSIVFYGDDICFGGGFIKETGPTYYELGRETVLTV